MARSTHVPIERRVDPERPADKPSFHGDSWLNRAAWPVAFLGATYLAAATYVYFRFGAQRAQEWLDFLAGPAAIAALTILVTAGITVVRKVRQMAKSEMWSATAASTAASTKAEVTSTREEMRALVEEVLVAVKSAPAGGREPDPTTGEVKALVVQLASRMERIEATSAAAAKAAASAQASTAGYGQSLASISRSVTAITGQTPAQAPQEAAQEADWRQEEPEAYGGYRGRSGGRTGASAYGYQSRPDPLDTRYPHHRDVTAEQPAVSAGLVGDEHEDYTDELDDGPGLDTSVIRGFRQNMAREDDLEREARDKPVPRFPRPDADEATRQEATRRLMRERQARWTDPQEGPR